MSVAEKIEKPQAVTIHEPSGGVVSMTPMAMLDRAIAQGAGMDVLEKLMALQERWDANQARKAFDNAMSSAKAEIPMISKNRVVDFTSAKGRTNYRYEDLAEVAKTVTPILAKFGLSYRFRTTSAVNEPVTVTCIVSHRDGHFEENTLCAGRDESGNKNSIQAVGSTLTYLQRMTLKAALGLAASNDDDGKAVGVAENGGFVTDEQVAAINKLIADTGTNLARFCGYMKVEAIADIPAKQYQRAIDALNAKKGQS
jgi:hypothetical protein